MSRDQQKTASCVKKRYKRVLLYINIYIKTNNFGMELFRFLFKICFITVLTKQLYLIL